MDFDWTTTHSLGILFLDWLLYHSDEVVEFGNMVERLLSHFDKLSISKQFVPHENNLLAYRLLLYRLKKTDNERDKQCIKNQLHQILKGLTDENIKEDEILLQDETLPKPVFVDLVALGPSEFDNTILNKQALKVVNNLYKSSANKQLGDHKTADRFARCAYNAIGSILWSHESRLEFETLETLQTKVENSPFTKLMEKLKMRKEIVKTNVAISKQISQFISNDELSSDDEEIDSQNLFKNTEIRQKNREKYLQNVTPVKKFPTINTQDVESDLMERIKQLKNTSSLQKEIDRGNAMKASPSKSLLRTPTSEFKKNVIPGKTWPVKTVTEPAPASPKIVSFDVEPKVKEFLSDQSFDSDWDLEPTKESTSPAKEIDTVVSNSTEVSNDINEEENGNESECFDDVSVNSDCDVISASDNQDHSDDSSIVQRSFTYSRELPNGYNTLGRKRKVLPYRTRSKLKPKLLIPRVTLEPIHKRISNGTAHLSN